MSEAQVRQADVEKGLRDIDVRPGDMLLVHLSLSSFGRVQNGAPAVVAALMAVLGPEGTLAMPSFPAFPRGEYGLVVDNGVVFDVRSSPSQMGKITDVFWRMPGVRRSINPTHAVAAWGRRRDWLISGHERCERSCGAGWPFHKLCQAGGKILLVGCDHRSNTTLHCVEGTHGAPTTTDEVFTPKAIDYDGREVTVPTHSHRPGLRRHYDRADAPCREAGIQRELTVGRSAWRLVGAGDLYQLAGSRVRRNPRFFLDDNEGDGAS